MLTLEDYIVMRKKQDNMDEFNKGLKKENLQLSMNYVLDYFNQYLINPEFNEEELIKSKRIKKYRNTLRNYESTIREWLVAIYETYEKKVNLSIRRYTNKNALFFLYNTDREFRALASHCYNNMKESHSFLVGQEEMIYLFLKEHHRIEVNDDTLNNVYVSEKVNSWMRDSLERYQVDLYRFAVKYLSDFFDDENMWDVRHKVKCEDGWREYIYDYKQKANLFNIETLYPEIAHKTFMKGKKDYLEMLFMYVWLHEIDGDDEYWLTYADNSLAKMDVVMHKELMDGVLKEKVPLEKDFMLHQLFNHGRGGTYKAEWMHLIGLALEKEKITVDKFIISDGFEMRLLDNVALNKEERMLKRYLMDHHNEDEDVAVSLVYVLKLLDPNMKIMTEERTLRIESDIFEVSMNPFIDERIARAKLFFEKESMVLITTNEDINNFVNLLAVEDVSVYVLDYDYWAGTLYIYRISRDEGFFAGVDKLRKTHAEYEAEAVKKMEEFLN